MKNVTNELDETDELEDFEGDNKGDSEGSFPRIETLSEKQITTIARNHLVISLVKGGKSRSETLETIRRQFPDFKGTPRWINKLFARYKKEGAQAFIDKRLKNKNQAEILTYEIQKIILCWWYSRPAAGAKAVWRKVVEECRIKGIRAPGYETVQKFLKNQSEANKLARSGKIKVWDKQGKPVVRFDLTYYANQRWQIDHTRLDIWVRIWVIDHWEVREVWLTVVFDAHSRSVAGFVLSHKQPDAWTTAVLLRKAVLPKDNPEWLNKGLPSVLQPDRGRDFMSRSVQASVAALGIIFDPDPAYYPNRKGKIERFFLTLDSHLRILPGHHKAIGSSFGAAQKHLTVLLTREHLQTEIEHWIVKEYHQREHSETKRKPAELWEETVQIRMPVSEESLDSFLLKSDKVRKIRNTGVDFHIPGKGDNRGGRYWCYEFAWFYNREVTVSYNPEDLDSILVYCASTKEYIAEAWLMGDKNSKYSIADVKQARNQARIGLLERKKLYSAEIHKQDRRAVKRENFRRAKESLRSETEQLVSVKSPEKISKSNASKKTFGENQMSRIDELLKKFEESDGGFNK